jgi:carbon monoxide dehydrogenase subunit G
MKFTNEIELALPADEVFAALTDVDRVASCLPGARVTGRDGDTYTGAMRVKVGPIVADYGGTLTFEQLDHDQRRAVLLARGEETKGQGSAEARIHSSVDPQGDGSRVIVETDLQVHGRVAQFGSGPMEKIAKKMFADFAKNLEALMKGETSGGESGAQSGATTDSSRPSDDGDDALNVLDLVGTPWKDPNVQRFAPIVIAFVLGLLLGRGRRS